MPQTPNHGYNVPNKGDANWHQPLNDNFRDYDTDIELRDTDGNKGNYTPKQGAKFLATDTGVVYEGDGNNWNAKLALSRYSPASRSGQAGNIVAGHPKNSVASGISGATIAGGGLGTGLNEVLSSFGTVSGGAGNTVNGLYGTVGGGGNNSVTGNRALVAGGNNNSAEARLATVGGGYFNMALAEYATIAGGGPTDPRNNPNTTRNEVHDDYGTIGGGGGNVVGVDDGSSQPFGTVAGGEDNVASAGHATVGGGTGNTASLPHSTVAGGTSNTAMDTNGTVGGGSNNTVAGASGTIAGGLSNDVSTALGTVAGGRDNEASGVSSAVPGGRNNEAAGQFSLAAGRKATAGGDGSFAWGDSSSTGVTATSDSVVFQAGNGATIFTSSDLSTGVAVVGGSGSWSSLSARSAKSNVEPVDPRAALEGVRDIEVATWNYDGQDESIRHMGPMAEDFHDEFGLGGDRERISNVDADGVALAAIQGLADRLEAKDDRIAEQSDCIDEQADRIDELQAENEALRDRLSAVEERVSALDGSGSATAPADD